MTTTGSTSNASDLYRTWRAANRARKEAKNIRDAIAAQVAYERGRRKGDYPSQRPGGRINTAF